MFDPDHLLGDKADIGITCALIPRDTPGIEIGRRHLPLNIPFQNGPIRGHDVFVPLDCIIGGLKMAGLGWRMLVEQLSVGRCISLPANATGGALAGIVATGAYARIRRQFNTPIGRFEGVEQVIARMVGLSLHHGCGAQRHHGRHRCRREAGRAGRDPEISRSPKWAGASATMPWTCTAARASCWGRRTIWAASISRFRLPSRSKAPTYSPAT